MAKTSKETSINLVDFKSIWQKIEATGEKNVRWEAVQYCASNTVLYEILGDCLNIYKSCESCNSGTKQAIREKIEVRMKELEIRIQKTSKLLTLIVKCVFGSDRKRASKYASVLQIAIAENMTSENFPAWVIEKGGIEEVSRRRTGNAAVPNLRYDAETAVEQAKAEISTYETAPLASVDFGDALRLSGISLLIANPLADGKVSIVGALDNVSPGLLRRFHIEMGKVILNVTQVHQANHAGEQTNNCMPLSSKHNASYAEKAAILNTLIENI